jgi:hypothetical protein
MHRGKSPPRPPEPPGGSLRANAPVNAAAAALAACAPSVRITAGGFRPSAMPIRFTSRLAAACGPTPLSTRQRRLCQRAHLRCESQPGASAHPLCPSALPAAWRQPAGQRDCQRGSGGLASARTFGANRSRGLPPVRYAHPLYQPPGGSLRANAPVNAAAAALAARAPSVRNTAGGFRPTAD